MGWNRQLSTSPSSIDFHFSNYCLKPIMDIGKFLNFFCDSYFRPFSLTSINLKIKDNKKKWGRVWRWPVRACGAKRPGRVPGTCRGWKCLVLTKQEMALHLVEPAVLNRWVKVNHEGDVSGGAIGARQTRGVACCDCLNMATETAVALDSNFKLL